MWLGCTSAQAASANEVLPACKRYLSVVDRPGAVSQSELPHLNPPTIAQAQAAQYDWLIVSCAHCGRTAHVAFNVIRRPPATPIAELLPALICTSCGRKGPPTATIRRLAKFADLFPDLITISPAADESVVPLTEVTVDLVNPEE